MEDLQKRSSLVLLRQRAKVWWMSMHNFGTDMTKLGQGDNIHWTMTSTCYHGILFNHMQFQCANKYKENYPSSAIMHAMGSCLGWNTSRHGTNGQGLSVTNSLLLCYCTELHMFNTTMSLLYPIGRWPWPGSTSMQSPRLTTAHLGPGVQQHLLLAPITNSHP